MFFWNSIEKLDTLNTITQGFAVVLGIIAGILGLISFIFSVRKSSLEKKAEVIREQRINAIDTTTTDIKERTAQIKELEFRRLTKEQIEQISIEIKKMPKHSILFCRNNSKESQSLTMIFESIFKKAEWKIDMFFPATSLREVSGFRIGYNDDSIKEDVENIGKIIKSKTGFDVYVGGITGELGGYQIMFDVGIIPANEYQSIMDKVQ